jgi:hypothetical protein
MSTPSQSTKPRVRSQRIRIKGSTGKLEFGGWICRHSYLRVEDPMTGKTDWIDGAPLYRLAKAIVRRFEAKR